MRALMIARFHGDVDELTRAYDRAHRVIMQAGGAPGELRHHCGVGEDALALVGVWESEEIRRTRFGTGAIRRALSKDAIPSIDDAEMTVVRPPAVAPQLKRL